MITSTRIGRYGNLGNSMFQFAAVIGMSKKTGIQYAVPCHETYYDVNYECNNTSIFDGFDITAPTLDLGIQTFKEWEFPFHYVDEKVEDFTDMVGYFQSEKYFENAADEVRKQFKFKQSVIDGLDLSKYPDPSKCTSLHIRLGDYMKKRHFHPAQPARYWAQAMEAAAQDNVVIFSDDIDLAKRMFGSDPRLTYSMEQDPFQALYHMSLCKNNIICNSTFSWWGAWLGEANIDDKVVVAPKLWFGAGHKNFNTKDLIPERWQTL